MLQIFSIQLLFSPATWIWSQSSKKTGLLTCYVRSQDLPFYLTDLHNKSFIELGSEAVVQRCSVTKDVLRNFAKLTGKHICQSIFLMKLQASRPATLSKKRLWHRCFPVNFAKFLKTPFVTEHLRWLLLWAYDKSNALTIRFVSRVLWPWVFCSNPSYSDTVGKFGVLHLSRDGE